MQVRVVSGCFGLNLMLSWDFRAGRPAGPKEVKRVAGAEGEAQAKQSLPAIKDKPSNVLELEESIAWAC